MSHYRNLSNRCNHFEVILLLKNVRPIFILFQIQSKLLLSWVKTLKSSKNGEWRQNVTRLHYELFLGLTFFLVKDDVRICSSFQIEVSHTFPIMGTTLESISLHFSSFPFTACITEQRLLSPECKYTSCLTNCRTT